MSFAGRTLQGFAGLVAIATTPLAIFSTQKTPLEINDYQSTLPSGGGEESQNLQQQVIQKMEEILNQETKKEEGRGNIGYFVLEGLDKHVLFVFMQDKSLETPFFFYYDWRGKSISERIHKVEKITYQNWRDVTLTLKGETSKKLPSVAPTWMRRWTRGTEFTPETHCKINKKDNNSEEYTLTCQVEGQSNNSAPLMQNVKKDQITFSEKTPRPKK